VTVGIPEPYIKEIIIKYYLTVVIIKPRISIKAKLITSINTFYTLIKSREDIKIKDAQDKRRLKKLEYL
jgi:hypothetical protein